MFSLHNPCNKVRKSDLFFICERFYRETTVFTGHYYSFFSISIEDHTEFNSIFDKVFVAMIANHFLSFSSFSFFGFTYVRASKIISYVTKDKNLVPNLGVRKRLHTRESFRARTVFLSTPIFSASSSAIRSLSKTTS